MTDEKISVQTDAMLETIEIATADAKPESVEDAIIGGLRSRIDL